MSFLSLFLIALGLSMDAAAVSLSNGLCYKSSGKIIAFYSALAFGIFLGIMPAIGFFTGQTFANVIQSFDHWIAFVLLGIIGAKMVYEAINEMKTPDNKPECKVFSFKLLLLQAIATSIDALAVGVAFAVMDVSIISAASFICIVTFVCSLIGYIIGQRFGTALQSKAEIFGGVILIGIGIKILLEHTII